MAVGSIAQVSAQWWGSTPDDTEGGVEGKEALVGASYASVLDLLVWGRPQQGSVANSSVASLPFSVKLRREVRDRATHAPDVPTLRLQAVAIDVVGSSIVVSARDSSERASPDAMERLQADAVIVAVPLVCWLIAKAPLQLTADSDASPVDFILSSEAGRC